MKHRRLSERALVVAVVVVNGLVASCDTKPPRERGVVKTESTMSEGTVVQLTKMTVAFGHMSVGSDIANGLKALQAVDNRFTSIRILEVKDPAEITGPGVYHFRNGPNGRPLEKFENFKQALDKSGLGERLDVALFKLCYVDIQAETDVQHLFDAYVKTIGEVRSRFPRLTVVHVTTPLTTHSPGLRSMVKNFFKGDRGNIQRNRFNSMLSERYGKSEPMIDLGAVESTRPDGSREVFTWNGDAYFALWPGYSTDGGHLNDQGKRVAALEMIRVLAGLQVPLWE